jgi:Domain of unknown function (DUF4214)/WD40-like Beta Propeller Repeat
MNASGSDQEMIIPDLDQPTWSPDGTKIAGAARNNIYVVNADGADQKLIARGFAEPAWSPDGTKIAISDDYGIYLINADGSNLTPIIQSSGFSIRGPFDMNQSPSWSPDGAKIVFNGYHGCNIEGCAVLQISVANADGTAQRALVENSDSGFNSTPNWSPDGTRIIFARDGDLFVLNADGSSLINITNTNNANEWDPAWQSIPLVSPPPNQIDDAQTFVRQQYLDFLNREPDDGGLAYWTNEIARCGADAGCIHARRVDVSAAFFVENEFQQTGYYVYRFYKASFGRQPTFAEFKSDRSKVIGGDNLEASKQNFADAWVQRDDFRRAYPLTMDSVEFVNKVFDSAGLQPSFYDRRRLSEIQAMNAGRSRALVLRDVIEIPEFRNIPDPNEEREIQQISQYNPAFVLMQYFGYLRRDVDQGGYNFWLDVVNNREPNNYRGMVCAFVTSSEYQLRFGSVVTHSNADCSR